MPGIDELGADRVLPAGRPVEPNHSSERAPLEAQLFTGGRISLHMCPALRVPEVRPRWLPDSSLTPFIAGDRSLRPPQPQPLMGGPIDEGPKSSHQPSQPRLRRSGANARGSLRWLSCADELPGADLGVMVVGSCPTDRRGTQGSGPRCLGETYRDREAANDADVYLSIQAPLRAADPEWTITVWHDRECWRVDTGSADQANAFGVRSLGDHITLTDAQVVGLLLAEASAAWDVYEAQ